MRLGNIVAPRSGLAWKNSIDVGAGVVDYDYRGNVGVILFNHSDADFQVNVGDRVAQLILERISMASVGKCQSIDYYILIMVLLCDYIYECVIYVEEVEVLSETERGEGGFGSTGVAATTESGVKRPDHPTDGN